jgi:hypothetical protein
MTEVLVCQGLLESNGIPTFIPDENMKVIDPFVTGANALTVHLQVPRGRVFQARHLLAWRPEPDADRAEAQPAARTDLEKLGIRIRWASLFTPAVPYSIWLAWRYFRGVRRAGKRPEGHFWTVAALAFGVVTFCSTLLVYLGFR